MTKDEFAATLADRTDLTRTKAREVIECIFGTDAGEGIIATELDAGRDFAVTGFGRFGTRERKARPGRNPASGERIWISARTAPTFRAGKGLKERVADGSTAVEPDTTSTPESRPTLW